MGQTNSGRHPTAGGASFSYLRSQIASGDANRIRRYLTRRAASDDTAALLAPSGTHVYHIVRIGNKVQVMLNDHNRGTLLHQALEHTEKDLDVARVQANRGLVKHEDGILLATAHLARELKALGLPAREGGRRLAKREVTQPQVMEGLELLVGTLDIRVVRQG